MKKATHVAFFAVSLMFVDDLAKFDHHVLHSELLKLDIDFETALLLAYDFGTLHSAGNIGLAECADA